MSAALKSSQRDAGLVRAIGPLGLAASMVTMVVGSGIFVVPASLSAALGSLAPLAVLVCALGVAAIGLCVAEAGSRVPSSGGLYAAIEAAFGPCAGYIAGTLFWVSNVLACGAVSAALGDAVASLVPPALHLITQAVVVVGVVGAVCAVNIAGVARGMQLVSGTTILKLIPLALFLGVGVFAISARNYVHPAIHASGVGQALLLTLFAYQGFETGLCAAGEVRDPARSIPRALLLALAIVTALYVAIQVVAQGILGSALGASTVPLADAMARIHPALRLLMLVGASVSMLGWLTGDLLCSPRILFAFARDGLLPASLGRLSPHGHTPYVAILCYAVIAVVLALSGSFAQLAAVAALLMAALYIGVCGAAWRLKDRGIAQAGRPLEFRGTAAAALLGSLAMLAIIALGTWRQQLGLLVAIGASLLLYLLTRLAIRGSWHRQPAA